MRPLFFAPYLQVMVVFHRYLLITCLTGLMGMPASSLASSALLDDKLPNAGLSLQWIKSLQLTVADEQLAARPSASSWPIFLDLAINQAPSNQAAAYGLIAAQAQEKQAWINAWLPKVNAFASTSRQQQTYNGLRSRTPSSSVSLSAAWPLLRASERALVAAQSAATQQSAWREKLNQQQVAISVSTAYLDGVEATHLRQLTQAQLLVLQEQLRINEKRMEGGAGTVLDVLETRTRVEQTQSALQALDTRIYNQGLLIERFSGSRVNWPVGLKSIDAPNWVPPMAVPNMTVAMQNLAAQNPQTQEALAQTQSAQATQRARQLEQWMPSIDLVGQTSSSKQVARFEGLSETQKVTTRSVGVELSWPVFTSGLQQERIKEARALLNQTQAQLDDAQGQTQTELRSAYESLKQAQRVIGWEQQVVQSAQSSFEAVRKAFTAGIRNNVDVLNAQTQVYESQQRLVSATINALLTQVNILALLGQLDGPTIVPLTSAIASTVDDNATP